RFTGLSTNGIIRSSSGTLTSTGIGINLLSEVTGVLPVANGGTSFSNYTVGDLLYASGSSTLSKLPAVASGNVLHSGGIGIAPFYSPIVNADVGSGAAISYSKLNLLNSITDADITSSAGISYLKLNLVGRLMNSDINPAAAIAYSKLNLLNSIMDADIAASAGISYLKLNLVGRLMNSDINSAAAIAYSKLNLSGGILNSDISSSAAISDFKLATISTGGKVANTATTGTSSTIGNTLVLRDPSGNFSAGIITGTLAGNASNITGIAAVPNGGTGFSSYTPGDILFASSPTAFTRLPDVATGNVLHAGGVGAAPFYSPIVNSDVSAIAAIAYSKLSLTNGILNSDINTGAGIAYSKLNLSGGILNTDINLLAGI